MSSESAVTPQTSQRVLVDASRHASRISGIVLLVSTTTVLIGTLLPWVTFSVDFGVSLDRNLYQLGPIRSYDISALPASGWMTWNILAVLAGAGLMLLVGLNRVGVFSVSRRLASQWLIVLGPCLVVVGAFRAWHATWLIPPGQSLTNGVGGVVTLVGGVLGLVAVLVEIHGRRTASIPR